MQQRFSTALLVSALLFGSASAQSGLPVSDTRMSDTQMSDTQGAAAPMDMSATDVQTTDVQTTVLPSASAPATASVALPESAQAVRRILETRGLLDRPAPTQLPPLRGLAISQSLRALLPNAVWDTPAPAAAATSDMGADGTTGVEMAGTDASMGMSATDAMGLDNATMSTAATAADVTGAANTSSMMDMGADAGKAGMGAGTVTAAPQATVSQPTASQPMDGSVSAAGILAALEKDGRFTTFLSLVKFAQLENVIADGQYTLLVPTDAAFAALDPALVSAVKASPELAGYVLGYHVVPGAATPGQGNLVNVYNDTLPADISVTGPAITAGSSQAYALSSVLIPADLTEAASASN